MRGILVVIFTFLIIGLLYRWRSKQEKAKVVKLKEFIAQQENWASPKFNNGGFVVGIFIFLLGLFSLFLYFRTPDSGMPLIVVIAFTLFGLFMIYGTPFIRITREQIVFQPLLLKLLGLAFLEKIIPFREIEDISLKGIIFSKNAKPSNFSRSGWKTICSLVIRINGVPYIMKSPNKVKAMTTISGMPLSGVLKYKNKENRPSKNIKIPTTNPPLLNLGEAQFSCWAINSFNLTTFAFSCLDLQRYKSPIIRKVKITTSIPRINL